MMIDWWWYLPFFWGHVHSWGHTVISTFHSLPDERISSEGHDLWCLFISSFSFSRYIRKPLIVSWKQNLGIGQFFPLKHRALMTHHYSWSRFKVSSLLSFDVFCLLVAALFSWVFFVPFSLHHSFLLSISTSPSWLQQILAVSFILSFSFSIVFSVSHRGACFPSSWNCLLAWFRYVCPICAGYQDGPDSWKRFVCASVCPVWLSAYVERWAGTKRGRKNIHERTRLMWSDAIRRHMKEVCGCECLSCLIVCARIGCFNCGCLSESAHSLTVCRCSSHSPSIRASTMRHKRSICRHARQFEVLQD